MVFVPFLLQFLVLKKLILFLLCGYLSKVKTFADCLNVPCEVYRGLIFTRVNALSAIRLESDIRLRENNNRDKVGTEWSIFCVLYHN